MKGKYTIRENGRVVGEADNLLTNAARIVILRYLAGQEEDWADAVALGVSSQQTSLQDRRLGFEIGRGAVELKAPDIQNESVVVKSTIPRYAVGTIHELGLYSSAGEIGREADQLLITDFNPDYNDIEGTERADGRIGAMASLLASPGTARLRDLGLDISALGQQDRLLFAYEATGVTGVEVRLMNTESDYLSYSFTPVSGYAITDWKVDDFTVNGGGSILEPFTEVRIITTGTGQLVLDGMRIDDMDAMESQMLVSRAVLNEPIVKNNNNELEVEYSIQFNF